MIAGLMTFLMEEASRKKLSGGPGTIKYTTLNQTKAAVVNLWERDERRRDPNWESDAAKCPSQNKEVKGAPASALLLANMTLLTMTAMMKGFAAQSFVSDRVNLRDKAKGSIIEDTLTYKDLIRIQDAFIPSADDAAAARTLSLAIDVPSSSATTAPCDVSRLDSSNSRI
jgi:hypothetical protein